MNTPQPARKTTRPIRELVNRIVNEGARKGNTVKTLETLQNKLEKDLQEATDETIKQRLQADLDYLKGYRETPAAALADIRYAQRKVKP